MMAATSDGTTLMTKKANMSRVLLANYWEWVKQGRPLRT